MRTAPPLLAPIFRSEGQARLLAVTLLDGEYSLAELADRAGVAYPTAHREVGRLLASGILAERVIGRTRLIRANEFSPLTPALTDILQMTAGPVAGLKQALGGIEGIEAVLVYGSFAARTLHIAGVAPTISTSWSSGHPTPRLSTMPALWSRTWFNAPSTRPF
jgi:hypothetical protein